MMKLALKPPRSGLSVLAAVSGGADSVALLALLKELADAGEIALTAAHFEHGIRGEASREDAAFVRWLCDEWRMPLIEGAADVPSLAREKGVGLEQAARDARYAFLHRAREEAGADCVALAHHLDDQAETVLMHLLRGAGLTGASGMREWDGILWRPLLHARKAELIEYLTERSIPWREDATNAVADNPRNIIRLNAMPALEAAYPGAARALGRFAQIAQAEDDYMADAARAFLRDNAELVPTGVRLRAVPDVSSAIARRALREIGRLDAETCLAVEMLYRAERGSMMLDGGRIVERTGEWLYFLNNFMPSEAVALPETGVARLPGVGEIAVSSAPPVPLKTPLVQVLDRDSLRGACVRTRRPGDYIRPLGMGSTQKLSDYFVNRHIDRPMRDAVLLVARGSEVLWAAGVGISENTKIRPESAGVRLEAKEYRRSWGDNEHDGL